MIKVFVYGTLKKGEDNHILLTNKSNGHSEFKGNAKTCKKYPLIIGTKYNIPFMLYAPGKGNQINGEVYEVDENMLKKLDELEGHPEYYVREEDEVLVTNDDNTETKSVCWIYFLKNFTDDLFSRPTLVNYRSAGDHGLPYVERSQREPDYKSHSSSFQ